MKSARLAWVLVAPLLLAAAARRADAPAKSVAAPAPIARDAGRTPPSPRRLPPRRSLPPLARSILSQHMENHAFQMNELVWSVVFLEHEETRELAEEIANGPTIARPLPDGQTPSDDLSSMLPAQFFDLQDQLHARAKELADAARDEDDAAIAKAWGRLSESCVACHATYLDEQD